MKLSRKHKTPRRIYKKPEIQRLEQRQMLAADIPMVSLGALDAAFDPPERLVEDFGYAPSAGGWRPDLYPRMMADIDGNGQDDIVGFGHDGVSIAFSNGHGFSEPFLALDNFGYAPSAGGWRPDLYPRMMADVDGNGQDDIVGFGHDGVSIAFSNGHGFSEPFLALDNFGYAPSAGGWRPDLYPRMMADVDGNGQDDIVGFGHDGVSIAFSNGHGFSEPFLALDNFGYAPSAGGWRPDLYPRMMADVDGNGQDDIVGFGHDGVSIAFSNGHGFSEPFLALDNFGYAPSAGGWRPDLYPRMMADVDGNGQDDIVGFGHDGVSIAFSNGHGFSEPFLALDNFGYAPSAGGWRPDLYPRMMADVDGNGQDDIVGFGHDGVAVALSTGFGFASAVTASDFFGHSADSGGWNNSHPRTMSDIDGDGRADIVGFGEGGVSVSQSVVPNSIRLMHGELRLSGSSGNDVATVFSVQGTVFVGLNENFRSFDSGQVRAIAISGYSGDDLITVSAAIPSTIYAGSGDDYVSGGSVTDIVNAGLGNDFVRGGSGDDSIKGGDGLDWLYGDEGQDYLTGGRGIDTIFGGPDADGIYGGNDVSFDFMFGDSGADRFLTREYDLPVDPHFEDAQIIFEDGSSSWTEWGIETADQAFKELQSLAGNTSILKDTWTLEPLRFVKVESNEDWSGRNVQTGFLFWQTRTIEIADWNESDELANLGAKVTVIHEIAHNWHPAFCFWCSGATDNPYWGEFVALSRSSSSPSDFARPYGETNEKEDWATVWEYYAGYRFEDSTNEPSELLRKKLRLVDDFFNTFR